MCHIKSIKGSIPKYFNRVWAKTNGIFYLTPESPLCFTEITKEEFIAAGLQINSDLHEEKEKEEILKKERQRIEAEHKRKREKDEKIRQQKMAEKEEEKQAKIRKEEEKRKQDKLEEKLRKEKEEKRKQKGKEFYERMQRAKKEKADRIEAENKWYYWKHTLPTCSSNIKISDKSVLDLILTDLYDKSDGSQCKSFVDLLIESPQASREFLCMYQTHSDKEVAKEYGISISTVNEAINAIKSAYCIKRGAM